MIQTAIDIWKEIKVNRNFDEKYYDIQEADYIKKTLKLPKDKTIYMGLKSSTVSLEKFVKVFFEANQSYSSMMNDLLSMFQDIGVKHSDHQLEISFDFDKGNPYTIDLNTFKSQVEKWKSIEKEILIPDHPSIENFNAFSTELLKLNFPGHIDYEIVDFSNFDVFFNPTKNVVMNDLLKKYKDLLLEVVKEVKKYGTDKKTLGNKYLENEYAALGLDNWPWLVSNQLKQLSEAFDWLMPKHQERCLTTLQDFLKEINFQKQTIQKRIKVLEDYLDLPFWKKRYELYSIWIFKIIYDVIKIHNHKVHIVDGKLTFPFKETHLATLYRQNGQSVFIYCEKKTPLKNPMGKGRCKNIQPDYSFFVEPLSDVNSSILEIECKQYKRPNNDSFARAIIDYSNGRPKSKVFLVNHGDMNNANIMKKASEVSDKFDANRCELFASIIPASVNEKVLKKAIERVLFNKPCVSKTSVIKVKLTWGDQPKDLDLSVRCIHLNEKHIVDYQNKKFNDIVFKEDVKNGFGPEEITFIPHENSMYEFRVKDYDQTGGLNQSGAKVEFFVDEDVVQTYELDTKSDDDIWDVCVIKAEKLDENSFSLVFES